MRRGDGIELLTVADSDSHTATRKAHGIREDAGGGESYHTPVEFAPYGDLADLDAYTLIYDAGRPTWLSDAMEESLIGQFRRCVQRDLDAGRICREGSLRLDKATAVPEGVTINAGENVNLNSVVSVAKGVTINAGGCVYLSSVVSVAKGVTISAGGCVNLSSVVNLAEGVTINAGGYVYLDSVTDLAEGVRINAGGYVHLDSVTAVPEGVTINAGGQVCLRQYGPDRGPHFCQRGN